MGLEISKYYYIISTPSMIPDDIFLIWLDNEIPNFKCIEPLLGKENIKVFGKYIDDPHTYISTSLVPIYALNEKTPKNGAWVKAPLRLIEYTLENAAKLVDNIFVISTPDLLIRNVYLILISEFNKDDTLLNLQYSNIATLMTNAQVCGEYLNISAEFRAKISAIGDTLPLYRIDGAGKFCFVQAKYDMIQKYIDSQLLKTENKSNISESIDAQINLLINKLHSHLEQKIAALLRSEHIAKIERHIVVSLISKYARGEIANIDEALENSTNDLLYDLHNF